MLMSASDTPVEFDSAQFIREVLSLPSVSYRVMAGETAGGFPILAVFADGDVNLDGALRPGAEPEMVLPEPPIRLARRGFWS